MENIRPPGRHSFSLRSTLSTYCVHQRAEAPTPPAGGGALSVVLAGCGRSCGQAAAPPGREEAEPQTALKALAPGKRSLNGPAGVLGAHSLLGEAVGAVSRPGRGLPAAMRGGPQLTACVFPFWPQRPGSLMCVLICVRVCV